MGTVLINSESIGSVVEGFGCQVVLQVLVSLYTIVELVLS